MTSKDMSWLNSQPGRVNNPIVPKPKDLTIEDAMKMREKAAAIKVAEGAAKSLDPGEKPSGGDSEGLATSIVKASLDNSDKFIGRMNEESERLRNDILQAQKAAQDNLNRFMDVSLARIADQQERVDKAASDAMSGGAAAGDFNKYREVKALLKEFMDEMGMGKPNPATGMSDSVALQLKKMDHEHDLALVALQNEIAKGNRDWELRIRQMDEDIKFKREEYKDKSAWRNKATDELGDVVKSFAQSITKEREGGGDVIADELPPNGSIQSAPHVEAEVMGFLCDKCQTPIEVPEGVAEVACPNEECGMKYRMKTKKG